MSMGLPTINFSLKAAAETVAMRVSSGVVAMILRDEKANGVHTVYREGDIPAELGAENKAAIKRALIGYINQPERLYLSVIAEDDDIEVGFNALGSYSYDYLVGPLDIGADADVLVQLVMDARKTRYIGKVVQAGISVEHESAINFQASGIKAGAEEFTAQQYCSRIAGVLAGTPAECSATYAPLPELTAVDAEDNPDGLVNNGCLILVNDGRQIKLGRAVTSKVTLADGEPELLKKIKLVATMDLIRYYAVTTVEDEYLGKCANTYDNKCILISALGDYMKLLESRDVLKAGSSGAQLDATATRAYLVERAGTDTAEVERVKALSDAQVVKEDTDSHVFIRLYGLALDAMEDFDICMEALQ